MPNSVGPDQTALSRGAVWSGHALFPDVSLREKLVKLVYKKF